MSDFEVRVTGEHKQWPVKIPMFSQNSVVRHVRTSGLYKIYGTPEWFRLEDTGEPGYLYHAVDERGQLISPKLVVWGRGQTAMEDGRFVHVSR